jgi:hypothetical protein
MVLSAGREATEPLVCAVALTVVRAGRVQVFNPVEYQVSHTVLAWCLTGGHAPLPLRWPLPLQTCLTWRPLKPALLARYLTATVAVVCPTTYRAAHLVNIKFFTLCKTSTYTRCNRTLQGDLAMHRVKDREIQEFYGEILPGINPLF